MAASPLPLPERCDVFVVGAGLAGLAAAIGFAREGFQVALAGRLDTSDHGRTVALLGSSVDFLRRLGVWDEIERAASPLRTMRIVDDTGSLFAPRPVEFRSRELGRDAFGWNIENAGLSEILGRVAGNVANGGVPLPRLGSITRIDDGVARFVFAPEAAALETAGGRRFDARLVIGADGRASAARRAADIEVRAHAYGQSALTVLLAHERPHNDGSTEFHTREGPFTLVPLPGKVGAPNRSSLVWVMKDARAADLKGLDDAALADEIRRRTHGLLGDLRIEGGRGLFPMVRQSVSRLTGTRLALVGDAAHVFPPIGAQGLNLGLRDVQGALAAAVNARAEGRDIGGEATLADYAASRRADIMQRSFAVDALNRSLLAPYLPVDLARGLGLSALSAIRPLRRLAMREGVSPILAR